MKTLPSIILAVFLAALFAGNTAQAQYVVDHWTGNVDAVWGNENNWVPYNGSYFAPDVGNTVSFDNAGGVVDVLDLSGNISIGFLSFDTASAAAYTIGSGAAGSQTLRLDPSGTTQPISTITLNANVGNSQLFNANIFLSSVLVNGLVTDTFIFTNNSTTQSLTFAGGITSGIGQYVIGSIPIVPISLTVTGAGATTISGIIADGAGGGAIALTKTGAGMLTLGAANTYTGTTTLTSGTLRVNGSLAAASQLNIGTAGTLSGTGAVNGNVTLTGSGIINLTNGTIGGTLGITGGNWNGTGTVTGLVTSSSGTLTIGSGASLTASAGLSITGGSLTGSGTLTGSLTYTSSSSSTFAGIIAGSGKTVTLTNAATTLTLGGANTYTGATTINGGTIKVTGSLNGTTGTALTFGGAGTFHLDKTSLAGTTQGMGVLTVNVGEATIQSTYGSSGNLSLTFSDVAARVPATTMNFVTASGTNGTTNKIALTKFGGVTTPTAALLDRGVFFGGSNYAAYDAAGYLRALTYGTDTNAPVAITTGATLGINDATKNVSISGAITAQTTAAVNTLKLGTSSFTMTAANILSVNGLLSSGGAFTSGILQPTSNGGEVVLRVDAGTLTLSSVAQNFNAGATASRLTKSGAGTLVLTGASTYTGVTTVLAGTLQLGSGSSGQDGSISNTSNIVNNNAVVYNLFGTSTYSGVISGIGSLTKLGAGTATLGAGNTYTGPTAINAGMLQVGVNNALPTTTSVTLANTSGAVLDLNGKAQTIAALSGGGASGGNVTLGANGVLTVGDSTSTTFSGTMTGTGTSGLTKQGTGTLSLAGALTYSGPTLITGGKLQLSGQLPTTTALTASSGATLDLNGSNQQIGSLSGAGSVTLGGGTLTVGGTTSTTFDGTISGGGGLTRTGSGSLTLTNAITYTGATTLTQGTLQINGSLASTSLITVPTSATLGIGSAASVAGSVAVTGGTVNLAGTIPTGTTLTLTTGTINSLTPGGTAATVTLPVQNTGPVLNAPTSQELTVTNKLSQNNGGTVVTAGTIPFKVGGSNVVNTIGSLILQGGTTTIDISTSNIATGLDIRGWTNQNGSLDGSLFDFNANTPAGSSANSTFAGSIGQATGYIHYDNNGEYFSTNSSGVETGARPTNYDHHYTVEYRGKLLIPNTGNYSFSTTSDDGSALWINPSGTNPTYSTANVANGGDHGSQQVNSSAVALTGGTYYDFIVRFYENGGGRNLYVRWDTNGGSSFVDIPGAQYWHGSSNSLAVNLPSTNLTVTADSTLKANFAGTATFGDLTIASGVLSFQTATAVSFNTITATGDSAIASGVPVTVRNATPTVSVASGKTLTMSANMTGAVTKTGPGTLLMDGTKTYTGVTTIAEGTVIASTIAVHSGASDIGNATSAVVLGDATHKGTLSYTGTTDTYTRGFTVMAGGAEIDITTSGQTLGIATGAVSGTNVSLTIGGDGDTSLATAVNLGAASGALTKTGAGSLNIFNGTQTYKTLTTAADSGPTYVNTALGTGTTDVIANANISFGNVSQKLGSLSIGAGVTVTFGSGLVPNLPPLTTAYYLGTFSGNPGMWSATSGVSSNWATDAAGTTVTRLIPNAGTDVIFSATGAANQGFMTLGGNMSVNSLTVLGSTSPTELNGLSLDGAGGYSLTIGSTTNPGITINAGSGSVTLNPNIRLGLGQSWTNNGSNPLTVAGAVDNRSYLLTVGGSGAAAISGAISGSGGLTKTGAAAMTLSGASIYTGPTTISAGKITTGVDSTSTSGPLGFNSAVTLANVSGVTLEIANNVSLGSLSGGGGSGGLVKITATKTLTVGGDNTSPAAFAGIISDTAIAGGALTKVGSGTLILSGASTYRGVTTVTGGTLQVNGSLVAASQVNVGTAGSLAGSGTINGNATLTGGGSINFTGGGIVGTLGVTGGNWNGSGSVTGLVTSSSGTLTIGSGANLTANGNLNVTGGSIAHANSASTITGNVSYTSGTGSTFGGVLAGSGKTLTLNNAVSTLTLSGANTYTGATTVTAGTLALTSGASLGNTAITVNSSATLTVNPGFGGILAGTTGLGTAGATLTLNAGSTFSMLNTVGTFNLRQNDTFASEGLVASVASGTAPTLAFALGLGSVSVLNVTKGATTSGLVKGQVNFAPLSGLTSLTSGDYTFITAASGLGSSAFTLGTTSLIISGITYNLSLTNSTSTAEILTIVGGKIWTNGAANHLWTTAANWNGGIPSSAGDVASFSQAYLAATPNPVQLNGSKTMGQLVLNTTTTGYTIGTNTDILKLDNGIATAAVTVVSGTHTINAPVELDSNATTISVANGTDVLIMVGAITQASGTRNLTKTGAGSLTLSGANTYTGGTNINAGSLALSGSGTLGATSGVLGLGGGALDLGTLSRTVGAVTITAAAASGDTIKNGTLTGTSYAVSSTTGNAIVSANLNGSGGLAKSGAGTLTLTNSSNAYTGGNTVNGGTLIISGGGKLGAVTNALTLGGGALDLGASSQTQGAVSITAPAATGDTIQNGSLTGTSYAASNTSGNVVLSANLLVNGSAGLTMSGAGGTLTLTGSNTYTGVTTISAGILNSSTLANVNTASGIGKGSAGGAAADLVINGGALQYTGTAAATTNRLFTIGTSGATLDASGVTAGTLVIGSGGGNIAFSSAAPASLTLTGTGTGSTGKGTLSAVLGDSGTGANITSLTKTGAGSWTLTAANTYSGVTTISGGILNSSTLANVNTASGIGKGSVGGAAADLVINGGTLQYTGTAAATTNRLFTIGTNGATIDASGTTLGTLVIGSGGGSIAFSSSSAPTSLTLTGTGTGATGGATLSAVLGNSGAGANVTSLTKTGAGSWTLTAANTYSGATTMSAGTLQAGVASVANVSGAFGNNSAVSLANVAGVSLNITGFNTQIGSLTGGGATGGNVILGAATLTVGGDNTSPAAYAGIMSGVGGALTKIGTGTLTLSGANTYTGATTISAGSLQAGVASVANVSGAFGNNSAVSLANVAGVSLNITGFNTQIGSLTGGGATGGNVILGAATLTVGADNTSPAAYAGILSGTGGALTKIGTGTLILSGANTYTGATTISAGSLLAGVASVANVSGAFGNNSAVSLANVAGVSLNITGFNTQIGSLTGGGATGGNITLGAATLTVGGDNTSPAAYAGILSGTGALTKIGAGTLILSGANTYTGATTISAGTLKAGVASVANVSGAFGNNSAVSLANVSGATLDITGFNTQIGSLTGGGATGGNITLGAATLTVGADNTSPAAYAGILSGTGALTKIGTGTLILSGADTYTGATTISMGTLKLGAAGDATNSPLGTIGAGTLVAATGAALDLNGFTLGTAEGLTLNGTGVSSAGALTNSSASAATYSGLVTLGSASSIVASSGNIILSNPGTMTGATFGLTLGGAAAGSSLASIIGSSATITKIGTGTWTVSGANTYTGVTTISAGSLKAGVVSVANVSGAFGNNSAVTLANVAGVTLDITGFNTQIGSLTGGGVTGGNVTLGAATLTVGADNTSPAAYAGVMSGSGGALTKTGAGTLTLSGASTYTGATTVATGTLALTSGGSLANTAITVNSSGTFAVNPGGGTIFAGTTGLGTAGATLTLLAGSTFSMLDTGTFALRQNDSFASNGLVASVASGTAPTLAFVVGLSGSVSVLNVTKGVTTSGLVKGQVNFAPISGLTSVTTGDYTFITAASGLGASAFTLGSTTLTVNGATYDLSLTNSTSTAEILTISGGGRIWTNGAANHLWTVAGNWIGGIPSSAGDVASFLQANLAATPSPVQLSGSKTIGQLALNTTTGSGYTIGAALNTTDILRLDNGASAAAVTVTSGTHTINAPVELDSNATTVSVASGTDVLTMVGNITQASGTRSLTKTGAGPLTLSGANSYTGVTTINNGILNSSTLTNVNTASGIGKGSAGGSAADLVINGGTLQYTGTAVATTNRLFTIGASGATLDASGTTLGTLIIGSGGGSIAFSSASAPASLTLTGTGTGSTGKGTLSAVLGDSGSGVNITSLTKTGAGSWTLTAANTYSGGTTVSAGTLTGTGSTPLGATTGTLAVHNPNTAAGTAVALNLSTTAATTTGSLSGTIAIPSSGANTATINNGGQLFTVNQTSAGNFQGVIAGNGGFTLGSLSTNALTLSGANTYTGATTVSAGTLKAGVASVANVTGAFGNNSAVTLANVAGVTLDITGFNTQIGSLTGGGATGGNIILGAATLTVGGDNTSPAAYAGILSGTGALTKIGTGTLTLSAADTYTGATTISVGTLKLGAAGDATNSPLGTIGAGTLVAATGAALDLNGFTLGTAEGLTLNGTGVSSAGALTNSSASAATYSGLVTLGSASSIVASSGNIILSNPGTITGATFGLTLGGTAAGSSLASIIGTTSGTVTKIGTGTWTLSGANTYTGVTTISAGTLKAGVASVANVSGAFGNNSAVTLANVAGATLDITGFNTQIGSLTGGGATGGNVTLGAATLTVGGDNTSPAAYAGVMSGTGGALTKIGTGTLTLSGANTYTGATTISAGSLQAGVASVANVSGAFGNNSAVSLANVAGVSLNITGFNTQIGSLTGGGATGGNITLGAATLTVGADNTSPAAYAGILSGTGGALTKTGTGTLTLSAANTYSGGTTVNAGTLTGTGSAPFGATTGTLAVHNPNLGAGTAVVLNLSTTAATTTGSLSGTIAIPSSGANTATINNGGQLFTVNQTSAGNFQGVIAGSGGFTLGSLSTNALTLSGANTYTGATNVNTGTLTLGSGGSLGNTLITVASGATFAANPGSGSVFAGKTLPIGSGGKLTLTAGSAFTMVDSATGTFNLLQGAAVLTALTTSVAIGIAPTLTFELGGSLGAIDMLKVTRQVDTSAAVKGQIFIQPLSGLTSLAPGNYTFLTAGGTTPGLGATAFTLGTTSLTVNGTNYTLSLANSTTTAEILTITSPLVGPPGKLDPSAPLTYDPLALTGGATDVNGILGTESGAPVVPEPGTLGLLLAGSLGLLASRRKRPVLE